MSDLHEAAHAALIHDIRAEQIQAAERRDFNDALAAMVKKQAEQQKGNQSEQ